MKLKISLYFRRFNGPKEDEDSGYYSAIDGRKSCRIDVNLDDNPFEQCMTIYHEVTHFIFDLFTQYEVDNAKQQVNKRDNTLRTKWRVYNNQSKGRKNQQYKEELICCKVEKVVRKVLQKQIPKAFFKELFTNKKKPRIMNKNTKRRRKK